MQQPDRVVLPIVRPERIRTDEFREAIRLMRVRHALGPHFVQHDGHAARRDLMGRLGTRKTGPDDMDRRKKSHFGNVSTGGESFGHHAFDANHPSA